MNKVCESEQSYFIQMFFIYYLIPYYQGHKTSYNSDDCLIQILFEVILKITNRNMAPTPVAEVIIQSVSQ